jgi:hypothetical protein
MSLRLFAPACALAACLFYSVKTNAQTTDSTYLDLGRVKLQKDFTQNITIRGSDLQRFPFTNLTDALNVWLSGNYSAASLVYVIDGMVVTDVNQYSIYDIDEVTMVQNAATQLNGSSQQFQLVLVKTKRNLDKSSGIEVNGQINAVQIQSRGPYNYGSLLGPNDKTSLFNQYYLSAYKNYKQIHMGFSAGYTHDVEPYHYTIINARNTDRWHFNGYLNAPVWKGSTLDFTVNYTSNSYDDSGYGTMYYNSAITKQNSFNSRLTLFSKILPELTNQFKAGFTSFDEENNYRSNQVEFETPNGDQFGAGDYTYWNPTQRNIVIYNDLRYTKQVSNWLFSPALNFNYRSIDNDFFYFAIPRNVTKSGKFKYPSTDITLLTPSIDVTYKHVLNLTGGVLYVLNSNALYQSIKDISPRKKLFPFISASADVAHIINKQAPVNFKLYGSYALSNLFNDFNNQFTDLSIQRSYLLGRVGENYLYNQPIPDEYYKTLSLGTELCFLNKKLTISYNFENRKNFSPFLFTNYNVDNNITQLIYIDAVYNIHRVAASYKYTGSDNFTWRSSINANKIVKNPMIPAGLSDKQTESTNNFLTGGFTNRLSYKNWVGGIDMLYLIGKDPNATPPFYNNNSFSLQNLYAGLKIKTSMLESLEVYANGRNLLQNDQSIFGDFRRYFGFGFKANL